MARIDRGTKLWLPNVAWGMKTISLVLQGPLATPTAVAAAAAAEVAAQYPVDGACRVVLVDGVMSQELSDVSAATAAGVTVGTLSSLPEDTAALAAASLGVAQVRGVAAIAIHVWRESPHC